MAMTFQLKDFDGPLDLLLFLINKEKIDIKDIFVSQITDQYIDSVRNAPDLDMDDATDFLVMAATLLESNPARCCRVRRASRRARRIRRKR